MHAIIYGMTTAVPYKVTLGDAKMRLHLVTVAIKGDWPFLRKICHLYAGFTSKRLCHLCSSDDPRM